MSSRDLFAASRDLFVNIKDHLIIFDPTNGISINSHLLLINSPPWGGGGGLLASCLFAHLACSLLTLSHLSSVREKTPTLVICEARHNGPSTWEDNNDAFKDSQMPKEIVEEEKKLHKDAMASVAFYISNMMREWEDVADCIFAPYSIKYVQSQSFVTICTCSDPYS